VEWSDGTAEISVSEYEEMKYSDVLGGTGDHFGLLLRLFTTSLAVTTISFAICILLFRVDPLISGFLVGPLIWFL
jgi:hypothetical protein